MRWQPARVYDIAPRCGHHAYAPRPTVGFWLKIYGPSYSIVRYFSLHPGQAHNGYIDVINDLGYVGLALLLTVLLVQLRNLYLLAWLGEGLRAVFHLPILSSVLLLNVSTTSFLRTTHLWWIVLTLSIVEIQSRLNKPAQGK